jgi:hypothetical protein
MKGIKEIITLGSNEMMVKNHIWSLEVDRENDLLYAGLHDGLIKIFLMIDNTQKCKCSNIFSICVYPLFKYKFIRF